jgi:ubiquinone/menaquinone biosynthesis C-methylase UbiE
VAGNRPSLAYFRRRKVETALAQIRPGSTAGEIGCGTGDYTFLFATMGLK